MPGNDQWKLLVWDLDDSLWQGTLSEGDIQLNTAHANLIRHLAYCGVMSSICSNNDYELAREKLVSLKLWELFVFPNIQWQAKGDSVKQILGAINLRAENTLFIDDNRNNREEVLHYNPGIHVIDPGKIEALGLTDLHRSDPGLKRLESYRILEKKAVSKKQYAGSNEDFLRKSNIEVTIANMQMQDADSERVIQLIQRTNQLNFTGSGRGYSYAEFDYYLRYKSSNNYKIFVQDRYGDHGLVGFVSINNHRKLQHFLFSCRIMHSGIEQAVFRFLKQRHPGLSIDFDATGLEQAADWVQVSESVSKVSCADNNNLERKVRILFPGLCNTEPVISYLEPYYQIDRQFPYPLRSLRKLVEFRPVRPVARTFWRLLLRQYHAHVVLKDDLDTYRDLCNGKYDYVVYNVWFDSCWAYCKLPLLPVFPLPGFFFFRFIDQMPEYRKYIEAGLRLEHSIHGIQLEKQLRLDYRPWFRRVHPMDVAELEVEIEAFINKLPGETKLVLINLAEHGKYLDFDRDFINPIIGRRVRLINQMLERLAERCRDKVCMLDISDKITASQAQDIDAHLSREGFHTIANMMHSLIEEDLAGRGSLHK
jgi:FkbH-like protein